jgi:ferrous iron transport protein B
MMKLSELQNGERALIYKIDGDEAFRKRIIEMGFVKGRVIQAIKRAPLQDPTEFSIMGYNVSIRRKDASMIEVIDGKENPKPFNTHAAKAENISYISDNKPSTDAIRIALVGNPNCGKTTIFNFASNSHERVANYAGVTVSAKEASFPLNDRDIHIVDLPGTYSLSSYSPEELYVIDYLTVQKPDVVVNVIDSSNIERNLYLTTQLIDMGQKVIIALNMYDELGTNGDKLDYALLGNLIGIPVIPTVGTKGIGIDALFNAIVNTHDGTDENSPRMQLNYGADMDAAIAKIQSLLDVEACNKLFPGVSPRFIALKLLEKDKFIEKQIDKIKNKEAIIQQAHEISNRIEKIYQRDTTSLIADARYGFIAGALKETFKVGNRKLQMMTQKADSIITNKILGIPIFFAFIWFTFYCTFKLGEYPVSWIEGVLSLIKSGVNYLIPVGIARDLVIDGIIGGVGGVIVFLPSIMILFLFISIMEETGYMARTAFLMDKVMHKMGLHGKSFIPLLMGFGCNVPAIMATRTIESKRDRILTMLVIPFMSCSARLPVYVLFISAFFPVYKGSILFGMYLLGVSAAFITATVFSKTIFRKKESPFVMELPPYRMPTLKAVVRHMWFKTSFFLKKMATLILFAALVIWALGYFPRNHKIKEDYRLKTGQTRQHYDQLISQTSDGQQKISLTTEEETKINELDLMKEGANLEQSYISRVGKFIEPAFAPLGFDWKMTVSVLTGVLAKEVVVSSMGVLYQTDNAADETSVSLIYKLKQQKLSQNIPVYVYFGFLVFILLYFPCIGTLAAIGKETGNKNWYLFETFYTTFLAWIAAFVIHSFGNFLT